MKKFNSYILRLTGIFIFIFILSRLDYSIFVNTFKEANMFYFYCAIPLFFLLIFLKSWRWKILLNAQNMKLNHRYLFSSYMASFFIGVITPGRIGELSKAFYIKDKGYSLESSFWATLTDRLADILILVFICFLSILGFFIYFKKNILLSLFVFAFSLFLFSIVVFNKKFFLRILSKTIEKMIPARFFGIIDKKLNNYIYILKLALPYILTILIITLCGWGIYYLQLYLLSKALNLSLTFWNVIMFLSIISFLGFLPITFAGIGTRDLALVFFFSFVNIPKEKAIAFSSIILLIFTVNCFFSFLFWLYRPIRLKQFEN